MRFLLPALALMLAGTSIAIEYSAAPLTSRLCRYGFCRFDQMYSTIDSQGLSLSNEAALLVLDPSNPAIWCTYAELLSAAGRQKEAHEAFDRAVSFGPGIAPVLVRAANFDFAHGYTSDGVVLSHRILSQTAAFDQVIFSYLTRDGQPVSDFLGKAVPADTRAATSWIFWLDKHGSDQDLLATWAWMKGQGMSSNSSAVQLASILWARKSYRAAQTLWADRIGPADGYPHSQSLANRRFEKVPSGSPFDWAAIESSSDVSILRHNGLEIHFLGTGNTTFVGVREFAAVPAGRYRFSAEIQGKGLTTDQGPYFRVFSPSGSGLNVKSAQIKGDVARSWISLDFSVVHGDEALQIQIERRPSEKFDNTIAGVFHVYQVSLIPLSLTNPI